MKHTRAGWWTLGTFSGLTLLGLYVAAYYATVQPGLSLSTARQTSLTLQYDAHYGPLGSIGESVFRPMHLVDRWLRPRYWAEEIEEFPGVPRHAGESPGE